MFGGFAFLYRGHMCCGIIGNDLVVRVSRDEMPRVIRSRHVRPMDFTGKPLSGFVYVSANGYRTTTQLQGWIDRGLRFVKSDEPPQKQAHKRRRRE